VPEPDDSGEVPAGNAIPIWAEAAAVRRVAGLVVKVEPTWEAVAVALPVAEVGSTWGAVAAVSRGRKKISLCDEAWVWRERHAGPRLGNLISGFC